MINILIYDPSRNKLTENFTHEEVNFECMIRKKQAKKTKKDQLQIKSRNIKDMSGTMLVPTTQYEDMQTPSFPEDQLVMEP